jgi:hypothetical protein
LFFSSKRRAQDRLLFLYRHRVLDRFYPPARFGSGKPQAHPRALRLAARKMRRSSLAALACLSS